MDGDLELDLTRSRKVNVPMLWRTLCCKRENKEEVVSSKKNVKGPVKSMIRNGYGLPVTIVTPCVGFGNWVQCTAHQCPPCACACIARMLQTHLSACPPAVGSPPPFPPWRRPLPGSNNPPFHASFASTAHPPSPFTTFCHWQCRPSTAAIGHRLPTTATGTTGFSITTDKGRADSALRWKQRQPQKRWKQRQTSKTMEATANLQNNFGYCVWGFFFFGCICRGGATFQGVADSTRIATEFVQQESSALCRKPPAFLLTFKNCRIL